MYTRHVSMAVLAFAGWLSLSPTIQAEETVSAPAPVATGSHSEAQQRRNALLPLARPQRDGLLPALPQHLRFQQRARIDQGQQRSILDGKFKFDKAGRYGVAFHASTGKYFNWAYSDFMGGGNEAGFDAEFAKATPTQQVAVNAYEGSQQDTQQIASGGWSFYMRRLYFDMQPVDGVEFQYGSLDINRGAASEITTYDNDGYIDGGRVVIKQPKRFFFDEASITCASSAICTRQISLLAASAWPTRTTTSFCCARKSASASTPPSTTPGRTHRTRCAKPLRFKFPKLVLSMACASRYTSA